MDEANSKSYLAKQIFRVSIIIWLGKNVRKHSYPITIRLGLGPQQLFPWTILAQNKSMTYVSDLTACRKCAGFSWSDLSVVMPVSLAQLKTPIEADVYLTMAGPASQKTTEKLRAASPPI